MVKILIELNEEQNKKVEYHKIDKNFVTKQQAVLDIIDKFERRWQYGKNNNC